MSTHKIYVVVFVLVVFAAVLFVCKQSYAAKNSKSVYEKIYKAVLVKDGVKEITYDQFMQIRNSKESFVLVDALSPESFKEGHIDGAISFPLDTINKDTAGAKIPKGSNVIVYCGSFQCKASTASAQKLSELGYKALDYKGGLKEWQEKGNKLV